MNARDLMTPNPRTVTSRTPMAAVLQILQEMDIRHLPVVDEGELVGLVSDRDIRPLAWAELVGANDQNLVRWGLESPVSDLMSGDVVTVDPDTEAAEIIAVMVEHKIGAVPVVEGRTSRVVGIVSYIDVLRALGERLD